MCVDKAHRISFVSVAIRIYAHDKHNTIDTFGRPKWGMMIFEKVEHDS